MANTVKHLKNILVDGMSFTFKHWLMYLLKFNEIKFAFISINEHNNFHFFPISQQQHRQKKTEGEIEIL